MSGQRRSKQGRQMSMDEDDDNGHQQSIGDLEGII